MKITANNVNDIFKSKECNVETMEAKGYKLIKECFCDNSGLNSEKGLITSGLSQIKKILTEYPTIYTYLTSIGQFQVYVGIFIKTNKLSRV